MKYRKWKHAAIFPLVMLAWVLMKEWPEFSPRWFAGMGVTLFLGGLYLTEEIVWMIKRQGRPCASCGEKVQLKSFRVLTTCPQCGEPYA